MEDTLSTSTSIEMKPMIGLSGTYSGSSYEDDQEAADLCDDNNKGSIGTASVGRSATGLASSLAPPPINQTRRTKRLLIILCGALTLIIASFSLFQHHLTTNFSSSLSGGKKHHVSMKGRKPHHKGFKLIRSTYLPELDAKTYLFQHKKTQAQFLAYISSTADEDDKAFGVGFRTLPQTNNGIAHILEHSVLSGSRKYPAKDPFLHLMKGSLHTFLNAMTYNDRTVYPIASRNAKDFRNLMGVYLDAVFHPKCVEEDGDWILKQEGWRYEFVKDDDEEGEDAKADNRGRLEIKGVVYSEMKGVFSNPSSRMSRSITHRLFPDTPYHYDSGGIPKDIPSLTQAEFVDFYKRHYHPTNSKLFISGNLKDVEDGMGMIDEYLSEYTYDARTRDESVVPFQTKRFSHHLFASEPYPVEQIDTKTGQHMFSISWLLNDRHFTPKEELVWTVLDRLLIDTKTSPLNKLLMESKYGSDIIGYGLDTGLLQSTFEVGMKGVHGKDISHLEQLIMSILEKLAKNGFGEDDIAAAVNSIEFKLRSARSSGGPFGVDVFLAAMSKWNYDLPPESALEYEDALLQVKQEITRNGSQIFQTFIEKYLLENNHQLRMEMYPSDTYADEEIADEKNRIENIEHMLTDEDYRTIVAQSENLQTIQNTEDPPEVLATIPKLSLEDLDRSGIEYPVNVVDNAYGTQLTVLKNAVSGSSGIIYIDVGINAASIPFRDIELFPLFNELMREAGTATMDDVTLNRNIDIDTGGIAFSLNIEPLVPEGVHDFMINDSTKMLSTFFISGKCTTEKTPKLLNLMMEILINSLLDSHDKVLQILDRKISRLKTNLPSSGHVYAVQRARARYDPQAFISEKMSGVSSLITLQTLATNVQDINSDAWKDLVGRLENMRQTIIDSLKSGAIFNLTGEKADVDTVDKNVKLVSLEQTQQHTQNRKNYHTIDHPWIAGAIEAMKLEKERTEGKDIGIVVTSQVSYVSEVGLMYNPGEIVSGSTSVVVQHLKKGYLWHAVREQNGAYGVMAGLNSRTGLMYMASYRDPQVTKTLDAYNGASQSILSEIKSKTLTPEDIETAIIGSIGAIDGSSLSPREVGLTVLSRWMTGRTAERRQIWRDQVLNTSKKDYADFAIRLESWKSPSVVIVSSDTALESADDLDLHLLNAY